MSSEAKLWRRSYGRACPIPWLSLVLPTHYWPRWTQLLDGGHQSLPAGLLAQVITITVALTATGIIATRRDPSA